MTQFIVIELSTFEILEKCATIIIALSSLGFSLYIWKYQTSKDNKNLKLEWYKIIIIESKIHLFFKYFSDVQNLLESLNSKTSLTDSDKVLTNDEIGVYFSSFRLEFISLLSSVDKMLYLTVLKQFDDFYDNLTTIIFDDNINLSNELQYNEYINTHLAEYKSNILKVFVDFRCDNDSHKSLFN